MEKLDFNYVQEYLTADEGELHHIYGKPKNGKTYLMTKLAIEDLKRGQTVVANWKIKWEGLDERKNPLLVFLGLIGIKKEFWDIPKANFLFLDPADESIPLKLANLTDCSIYLDEGQRYYDSYLLTRMDSNIRMALALTAHFNRRIIIASQRSNAIHISLRGNVNRFYKMEKRWSFLSWTRFKCTEYQEMIGESPNELIPENETFFFGDKEIYNSYDYKFMRGDCPRSQPNWTNIYIPTWKEKWNLLWNKKIKLEQQEIKEFYLKKEPKSVFAKDLTD